jgi:U2 small nuclear ribonucleoprotein B''
MAAVATRDATVPRSKASKAPTYPPNQTLYITNLPSSKIQKSDLRVSLYTLFSTYGPVLDVVALRTAKMRGQAHIVFRDIQTATQAMRATQGLDFFGREMVSIYFYFCSFALTISDNYSLAVLASLVCEVEV